MQAKQPNRSSSSSWQDKTVDRRVVNTLFCGDFFHHVDDKVTLGDQLASCVDGCGELCNLDAARVAQACVDSFSRD